MSIRNCSIISIYVWGKKDKMMLLVKLSPIQVNKLGCGAWNRNPALSIDRVIYTLTHFWYENKVNPEGDTSQQTVLYQWSVGPFTVMNLESFLYLPFIFPLCLPMSRAWCFPLAKWQWGLEHHVLLCLELHCSSLNLLLWQFNPNLSLLHSLRLV